ncbi:MAG: enoyl-CoA hydratase/isomerase family protein [Acidimicrobiales bacterium]|nr:enoyl-CoA hydratase/isomerase family protein [Acidimicrobiales bacterium]
MRVPLDRRLEPPPREAIDRLVSLPFVLVGVTHGEVDPAWFDLCDVVVAEDDPVLGRVEENLAVRPIAGTTLALLLRAAPLRPLGDGLVAESSAYSVLQSGPEFAAWRTANPPRPDRDGGPRVKVEAAGARLVVTLTRPDRLNALDAAMRDELSDAFSLAAADRGITAVEWRGEGRSFCAGGDLDEFGTRSDPASAHLVRLQRNLGRYLTELEKPVTTYVHGPCLGSGIELAAFTDTVVGAPDATFALPEIGLGLVPGAGGTVSLTRRIGRLRTAMLAFTAEPIDVATAKEWGLIDRVEP